LFSEKDTPEILAVKVKQGDVTWECAFLPFFWRHFLHFISRAFRFHHKTQTMLLRHSETSGTVHVTLQFRPCAFSGGVSKRLAAAVICAGVACVLGYCCRGGMKSLLSRIIGATENRQ
jgi:hypothetical protein